MNSPFGSTFAGSIGVWIFFVISGFLITTLLLKEKLQTNRISLRLFYIRRFLRIIPVAYLFLITLVVLNGALKLQVPSKSFLSAFLFFQNLPKLSSYNWYVQHYWSLSVEEQFYLTFPFLLVYSINKYIKVSILLIVFIPVIEYLGFNKVSVFYSNATVHAITFVIINLLGNMIYILIGSLSAILLYKKIINFKDTLISRWLSLFLLPLAILLVTDSSPLFVPHANLVVFPVLIALVIVLNLNVKSVLTLILNNKVLSYIGVLSYSIYIWQQLFSNSGTWLVNINSYLLHVCLIFAIAAISYHFYEKPFLKIKSKFKARPV